MQIVTSRLCPRCGVGQDTDGDGNCAKCAKLTDKQVEQWRMERARQARAAIQKAEGQEASQ